MEDNEKKCSNIKHNEIKAVNYCPECNLYLCNKCTNIHSEFFVNHQVHNFNKNFYEIFTGKCNELNHKLNLQYFCKNHNKLCCAACLSKIKGKGDGQHFDCTVCSIEEIKEEKKNKLNENIKYLEDFSKTIEISINKLKEILKIIDENKEKVKKKISEVFTKIRSTLNDREDELLLEVDKLFEKNFPKDDIIKQGEKTPNQIKYYLEKGKILNDDWNDNNKLISNINKCINIENNIKNIVEMNETIKKHNSKTINIKFLTEENEINNFLENIKTFGNVGKEEIAFKFKFSQAKNYIIKNNGLSITKNKSEWNLILGDKEIPKNMISKWKIKINTDINASYDDVYIGIGKNNSKGVNDCWSIYNHCSNIQLCLEGNCTKYNNKYESLKKGDIIEVIIDRISNQLSFFINNIDFGIACSNIPKDDKLFPIVLLYEQNLNVEIL